MSELEKKEYTPQELFEATKLEQHELEFIDDMMNATFDQAIKEEHRPYVLMALCGGLAANLVHTSEGKLSIETVLQFVEMAARSQIDYPAKKNQHENNTI